MKILEKQLCHLLAAAGMLLLADWLSRSSTWSGSWAGWSTRTWFWLSLAVPIVHQFYVAVFWRGELYYGWLSTWFGEQALGVFGAGFLVLLAARPAGVLGLSLANASSLEIPPLLQWGLILVCLALSGCLGYSVKRYFSFWRALGIDHFQPDVYRDQPFVKQGIFRWSPNAMYVFGFTFLYVPGLVLASRAGLISALCSHLFIWAHYYFTEKPDFEVIYGVRGG